MDEAALLWTHVLVRVIRNHPKPTDCIGTYEECGAPIETTRRSTSQFQRNARSTHRQLQQV